MKRRSFIGSLLAMITAAFALPRIPKPKPAPVEVITPPTLFIACRGAMGFEIGDPIYWDPNTGELKKWDGKHPVFGYVHSMDEYTLDTKTMIGGIIE